MKKYIPDVPAKAVCGRSRCKAPAEINRKLLEKKEQKMLVSQNNGSTRRFYSVVEVAEMFGLSKKSVYRLLDRGLLKSSSALRHKRIPKESVEAFVNASVTGGGQ